MAEGDKKFDTKLPMQNININAATKFARGFQLSISPRQCGGGAFGMAPGGGAGAVECLETLSVVCRLTESRDVLRAAAAWVVSLQAKARAGLAGRWER